MAMAEKNILLRYFAVSSNTHEHRSDITKNYFTTSVKQPEKLPQNLDVMQKLQTNYSMKIKYIKFIIFSYLHKSEYLAGKKHKHTFKYMNHHWVI